MNLARREEERLDGSGLPLVEQAVYLFGDFVTLVPRLSVVMTAEDGDAVRVVARRMEIYCLAGRTNSEHLAAVFVGHQGAVAEGIVPLDISLVAPSVGQHLLSRPRLAVVAARATDHVYGSIADVGAAIAVVGRSDDVAVAACGDGGDAVGDGILSAGSEKSLPDVYLMSGMEVEAEHECGDADDRTKVRAD